MLQEIVCRVAEVVLTAGVQGVCGSRCPVCTALCCSGRVHLYRFQGQSSEVGLARDPLVGSGVVHHRWRCRKVPVCTPVGGGPGASTRLVAYLTVLVLC